MAQVARDLNLSLNTIRSIFKRYNETGLSSPAKRGGNQRKKLTDEIIQRITVCIEDNYLYTLDDIANSLTITVHPATVWKWLKKLNYS